MIKPKVDDVSKAFHKFIYTNRLFFTNKISKNFKIFREGKIYFIILMRVLKLFLFYLDDIM